MHWSRFFFEALAAAIGLFLWFRPGPRTRRRRFRRRVSRLLRKPNLKRAGISALVVFVVVPRGLGLLIPELRSFPSLLEAQKLRLTYGVLEAARAALLGSVSPSDAVRRQSMRHGVEPALVQAVLETESSGRRFAVSMTGAMGLMQIMPGTFYSIQGGNPFAVENNVSAGARYLRRMLDRFGGDYRLSTAAYHAGPTPVSRCLCVPPSGKTPAYVARVARLYRKHGGRRRF